MDEEPDVYGKQPSQLKDVLSKDSFMEGFLERHKPRKGIHSEKHELVDEIRTFFGETAKKGKGSFGFYLGFFNRLPLGTIRMFYGEVKQSRDLDQEGMKKVFWWKVGKYLRNKKQNG